MTPLIELVGEPLPAFRQALLDGLRDFNSTAIGPYPEQEALAVAIRDPDAGTVLGGLWGRTAWGWLTIEILFVPEELRGGGLARRLIGCAENEALRRGCHSAWLDTLNEKALPLYECLGYVRFGELEDYPEGQSRTFLRKRLLPSGA
jgi:GNAT superfamily N-acetyltransferase